VLDPLSYIYLLLAIRRLSDPRQWPARWTITRRRSLIGLAGSPFGRFRDMA